jgi:rod shape determining protein RodA
MNRSLPWYSRIDYTLLLPAVVLTVLGILTMRTPDIAQVFFEKQVMWLALAVGCFLIAQAFHYRFLRTTSATLVIYGGVALVLVATLLFGSTIKGTKGWINFGAFSLQAADLAKAAVIIILTKYFSRRHVEIRQWRHIFVSGGYVAALMGLILLQPDFGSAMVLALIWGGMVFASGIPWKRIGILLAAAAVAVVCMWFFVFQPYQKARLATFLNPMADVRGSGYNVYQAVIAVGSGGIWGKGVGYGTQSKLEFLPEYHTDFIFAAFSEEWGYAGFVLVLTLFATLVFRLLYYAWVAATNYEALFAIGIASMFTMECIVNIGMNIGLLPVTGIALPFMSYGGSHLLVEFTLLGMAQGMYHHARSAHKDDLQREVVSG